jgi:hypothetical protein
MGQMQLLGTLHLMFQLSSAIPMGPNVQLFANWQQQQQQQ